MITADLHLHTTRSDGKSSIEDYVIAARQKGIQQIGITEHGLRHVAYGVDRKGLLEERREVDDLRTKYTDIEIYLGIEANIYAADGSIDLKDSDVAMLDYVCIGYHMVPWPKSIGHFFRYNLPGLLNAQHCASAKRVFTTAYIKAIQKGYVRILTHPCYRVGVDIAAVAQAAYDYGVAMELNGKKVSMSDEEVCTLFDSKAQIIANSDAHSAQRVGDFSVPFGVMERLNLDKNRLINWGKKVQITK